MPDGLGRGPRHHRFYPKPQQYQLETLKLTGLFPAKGRPQ
ncbi:hypothetical protein GFS31_13170 [Leptolyngbya sp. BL0902]|nr:hypothetical protein GFS31_13170 [Leptolyngbya sp. BL0902]